MTIIMLILFWVVVSIVMDGWEKATLAENMRNLHRPFSEMRRL